MSIKTALIIFLALFSIIKIISLSKFTKIIADKAKQDLAKQQAEEEQANK